MGHPIYYSVVFIKLFKRKQRNKAYGSFFVVGKELEEIKSLKTHELLSYDICKYFGTMDFEIIAVTPIQYIGHTKDDYRKKHSIQTE